jgi:transaldolase
MTAKTNFLRNCQILNIFSLSNFSFKNNFIKFTFYTIPKTAFYYQWSLSMELYVDTANIEHIRHAASLGFISGVTTNPSLLAKEDPSVNIKERLLEIHQLVGGHLSVEVISTETKGMLKEAEEIISWFPEATIKIPMIPNGLAATKELSRQGIPTNVTLVFSPTQAIAANNAGATYVSLFMGRLDDISCDSTEVLYDICEIWDIHDYESKIIAASIRHPIHIVESAKAGADIATVPYKVLMQSLKHPLTDAGLDKFLADYKKMQFICLQNGLFPNGRAGRRSNILAFTGPAGYFSIR